MPALPAEPNKIDGKCGCGADVWAGEGFFIRKIRQFQCRRCRDADVARVAREEAKLAEPKPEPVEDDRIKVRVYYNDKVQRMIVTLVDVSRTILDTVKGLCETHGFTYSSDLGGWNGPVGSLPELVEVIGKARIRVEVSDKAAQALLMKADQNKKAVAGAGVRVANTGRRGRKLKGFQKVGVEFLASRTTALLADDGGCIDGNAVVQVNRARRGFKTTLANLCYKFNGGASSTGRTWDLSIPTYVKALTGDHLRLHKIRKVIDSGVKPVVKLTLTSGKILRLTADHEICIDSNGSHVFASVGSLKPGDTVVTNGRPKCKDCGSTDRVATYAYAKFPGYCRTCIYRKKRSNSVVNGWMLTKDGYREITEGMRYHPSVARKIKRSAGERPHTAAKGVLEHRLVVEANMNGMTLKEWLEICRANAFSAKHQFLRDDVVVHHKNGDRLDNRPENLEVMTKTDHAVEHGRESKFANMDGGRSGKGGLVLFVPVDDTVASVEPDGEARVYDIVCEDPWRNFVANGIVVHNCGKTAQVLCAAGPNPRIMVVAPKIMVGAMVKGKPVGGWIEEVALWRPDIKKITVIKTRDEFRWPEENELIALNYELMPISPDELAREATKSAAARRAALARGEKPEDLPVKKHKIADEPPEGVELVVDEAHALANPNSQRTKRFKHLKNQVLKRGGKIRGVTATPMKNNAKELYSVLDAIGAAQIAFGSFEAYAKLHDYKPRQVSKTSVVWEFNDPSPEVAERLKRVMLRRKKRDVLTELPPLSFRRLVVDVDREALKLCDAAMKEIEASGLDLEQAMELVDESRSGVIDFTKISAALAALAKVKAPYALERADEFERTGTPVVFFAAHLSVVEMLGKRKGWGALVGGDKATANFDGEPVSMKGPEVAKCFQSGRLDNITATIQYAGVGITLTRAANAFLVEKLFNPAMNSQAIWRIERIGQENPMVVTDLVADHPLDIRMSEILEKKIELYSATVDAAAVAPEDLDKREDVVTGFVEAAKKTAPKRST